MPQTKDQKRASALKRQVEGIVLNLTRTGERMRELDDNSFWASVMGMYEHHFVNVVKSINEIRRLTGATQEHIDLIDNTAVMAFFELTQEHQLFNVAKHILMVLYAAFQNGGHTQLREVIHKDFENIKYIRSQARLGKAAHDAA
jgi:hypothetical protein